MSGGLSQQFPSRSTAWSDPKTGLIDSVWFNVLRSLWLRTGGGTPTATTDTLTTELATQEAQIVTIEGEVSANTSAISALSTNLTTNYVLKVSAEGVTIAWGSPSAGVAITQRAADGAFVISTRSGTPLMSVDGSGNVICAGSLTTNTTP